MNDTEDLSGTLEHKLAEVERLLFTDAAGAALQAEQILLATPGHPVATLLLGVARRFNGNASGAVETLEPLTRSQPDHAAVHYEFGRACSAAGRSEQAIAAMRRAVELQPALPGAWNSLADELRAAGDGAAADAVTAERIQLATRDPRLRQAVAALREKPTLCCVSI
jgi:Flp pilus assembly protein TadD